MIRNKVVFGPDIETMGLNPYECKIITIQLRKDGTNHIWKEWKQGEYAIISEFLSLWDTIPRKKTTFISYNAAHFDIPFILVRAHILVLRNPERIWNILVRYPSFLELYQLLGDKLMKFAKWKRLLVGSMNKYSGEDIPKLYLNKEYEEITKYVEDELVSFQQIYEAIRHESFFKALLELRRKADPRG